MDELILACLAGILIPTAYYLPRLLYEAHNERREREQRARLGPFNYRGRIYYPPKPRSVGLIVDLQPIGSDEELAQSKADPH